MSCAVSCEASGSVVTTVPYPAAVRVATTGSHIHPPPNKPLRNTTVCLPCSEGWTVMVTPSWVKVYMNQASCRRSVAAPPRTADRGSMLVDEFDRRVVILGDANDSHIGIGRKRPGNAVPDQQ
jgi:hypothetical protein